MKAPFAVRTIALVAGIAAGTVVVAAAARADCNCLYDGRRYEQEDTVCMRTPQGMRQARCGMLDNVAWWQMLDEPCPGQVSQLPPPPSFPPKPPAAAAAPQDAASSR